jgi:CHAD domain-containing protein
MPLDLEKLDRPLLKLRKLVRRMSKVPTQGEVHAIRTNTRRVEATLDALQLSQKRKGRRVLRAVTPIRKNAGDVRDMDVLTSFSATISTDGEDECLVKLLEHLGEERALGASKLRRTVTKRGRAVRKRLRVCSSLIEKHFDKQSGKMQKEWPADATAAAFRVYGDLAGWPKISAANLHPFRLKVKQMRYILQLSGEDNELTESLRKVKDRIGEWHDWTDLAAIAKDVLADCKNCKVISQIELIAKQKFQTAVRDTHHLRAKYFTNQAQREKRTRKKAAVKKQVLQATAGLAA